MTAEREPKHTLRTYLSSSAFEICSGAVTKNWWMMCSHQGANPLAELRCGNQELADDVPSREAATDSSSGREPGENAPTKPKPKRRQKLTNDDCVCRPAGA
jgi:hypothetical protein